MKNGNKEAEDKNTQRAEVKEQVNIIKGELDKLWKISNKIL